MYISYIFDKNNYFSKEDATFKIKSGGTSEEKEENVLRLRKTRDNESASNEKATTNKKKEPLDKNDPIFWFGILLPSSLHQARESFIRGFKIKLKLFYFNYRFLMSEV